MKSLRIINMRSLVDTGTIELKPINMLVGCNSSGKSTFLRTFPLLKQSFFKRINGPILWAGEEVDFGSFSETKNKTIKENCISLEFTIPYSIKEMEERLIRLYAIKANKEIEETEENATFVIEISNNGKNDIISKATIISKNEKLCIDNLKEEKYYNDKKIIKEEFKEIARERYRKAFNDNKSMLYNLFDIFDERDVYNYVLKKVFTRNTEEKKDDMHYRGINEFYRQNFLDNLIIYAFINDEFDINQYKEEYLKKDHRNQEVVLDEIDYNFFENQDNINLIKIIFLSQIAKYCLMYMEEYFSNINYIKPVRANANRYYRLVNLSVDQIDSDGSNLPIFINSLGEKSLKDYNTWLEKNFDFKVIPVQTEGHVSINIEKYDKKINLSDTGHGYSQLLPIITQLWVVLNQRKNERKNVPIVFAVEQPELHLHPELQAKLTDVIATIAKNKKNGIQFILETHSEVIINRLGNLIYKNKINKDDVNVVIFEKELEEYNTQVKLSSFNEEGYLENWPIGFFAVDDIK